MARARVRARVRVRGRVRIWAELTSTELVWP